MEEEYKKRFTKHDIDCGYYVDEELACEEIKSNIDGSIGIQGDAISKLAILENMIEDGELVEVVRCKDCKHSQPEDKNRVYCTIKGRLSNKQSFCEAMERK